ncbi:4'-phosphopantetheinyl transferase, partial [Auriscalpium vulgare]
TIARMGILGIGVDIVHLPRIIALMARRSPIALATRILSRSELLVWTALSDTDHRNRYIATRWAAKEAAYKACFPVIKPTWKEFSIHKHEPSAKPSLIYHPFHVPNAQRMGNKHVSISHDGEYVIATVLIETPEYP